MSVGHFVLLPQTLIARPLSLLQPPSVPPSAPALPSPLALPSAVSLTCPSPGNQQLVTRLRVMARLGDSGGGRPEARSEGCVSCCNPGEQRERAPVGTQRVPGWSTATLGTAHVEGRRPWVSPTPTRSSETRGGVSVFPLAGPWRVGTLTQLPAPVRVIPPASPQRSGW